MKSYYFVLGYMLAYVASLVVLRQSADVRIGEVLLIFGIFGVGFSAAVWLITRKAAPLNIQVREPRLETAFLLLYLVPLAFFIRFGFDALHRITSPAAQQWAILLSKLAVFVVAPALPFLFWWKYSPSELAPFSARKHTAATLLMSALVIGFQLIFGRGLGEAKALHAGLPTMLAGVIFVFIFLAFDAGLVEEFFFRALLQTRVERFTGSQWGGILMSTVLFGLVHAPGLYYRTQQTQESLAAHPSVSMAVAYSIAVTSVAGIFLGVLWARTRNMAVVVIVHAATDLVPNLAPMMKAFGMV